jgi:nitrogen fixation/metabolism regulation signal transduction histidine kinase
MREFQGKVIAALPPFAVTIVVVNLLAFGILAFMLSQISSAVERRDNLIKSCVERSNKP